MGDTDARPGRLKLRVHGQTDGDKAPQQAGGPAPQTAVDPVCGMTVVIGQAAGGSHEHQGTTYHFCAPSCRTRFAASPESFLGKRPVPMSPPPAAAGEDVLYICPMDLEVQQVGPGTCPICGMALEPKLTTRQEQPNPELQSMSRRLKLSAILTAPLLVLAMSDLIPGQPLQQALGSLPLPLL